MAVLSVSGPSGGPRLLLQCGRRGGRELGCVPQPVSTGPWLEAVASGRLMSRAVSRGLRTP